MFFWKLTGRDGWEGEQKCPLIFFIRCGLYRLFIFFVRISLAYYPSPNNAMGSGVSLTPMSPRGFLRWPLALHCRLGSGPGSFFFCALSTSPYSYIFPAVFFLLLSPPFASHLRLFSRMFPLFRSGPNFHTIGLFLWVEIQLNILQHFGSL